MVPWWYASYLNDVELSFFVPNVVNGITCDGGEDNDDDDDDGGACLMKPTYGDDFMAKH
jgi:hypothetical protein